MPADKTSLPAYAERGVLLDPNKDLWEIALRPRPILRRTFFQILREDFLQPFFRRMIGRRRS